ncbi:MAG: hypothetical protein ACFFDN_19910 [Candidatus Hodarchaeota archaeon]
MKPIFDDTEYWAKLMHKAIIDDQFEKKFGFDRNDPYQIMKYYHHRFRKAWLRLADQ